MGCGTSVPGSYAANVQSASSSSLIEPEQGQGSGKAGRTSKTSARRTMNGSCEQDFHDADAEPSVGQDLHQSNTASLSGRNQEVHVLESPDIAGQGGESERTTRSSSSSSSSSTVTRKIWCTISASFPGVRVRKKANSDHDCLASVSSHPVAAPSTKVDDEAVHAPHNAAQSEPVVKANRTDNCEDSTFSIEQAENESPVSNNRRRSSNWAKGGLKFPRRSRGGAEMLPGKVNPENARPGMLVSLDMNSNVGVARFPGDTGPGVLMEDHFGDGMCWRVRWVVTNSWGIYNTGLNEEYHLFIGAEHAAVEWDDENFNNPKRMPSMFFFIAPPPDEETRTQLLKFSSPRSKVLTNAETI